MVDSVDDIYDKEILNCSEEINSIDELRNEISKLKIEFATKIEEIQRDTECKENRLKSIEDQFSEMSKISDNLSQLTNANATESNYDDDLDKTINGFKSSLNKLIEDEKQAKYVHIINNDDLDN